MGRPIKTCPVCEKQLRVDNKNGYCRKHRYLSPVYRKVLAKAVARCDERHPDRHKEATARYRKRHPERVRQALYAWRKKRTQTYIDWYKRMHARRRGRIKNAEGSFTKHDVNSLAEQQGHRCYYCKTKLDGNYHIDHKTPLSRGGSNWPRNLAITCPSCNLLKKARTEEEFWAVIS